VSSQTYPRYVTLLLLVTYVFNQLDRRVFDILMEPLKQEFTLSDAQLGFLGGGALFIMYSVLGIPVARWADRTRRLPIMTAAVAIWSAVAASTAIVTGFWTLTAARVGVGIGEAGFSAMAVAVISDLHSDTHRARAISNFMLALPIAGLVSNLLGGWINQLYGWRPVFLVAGLPGLLLAVLLATTVREPPRRSLSGSESVASPSFGAVLAMLWKRASLRHLAIAQGLSNVAFNSMGWVTVLLIRQHHMRTGELGSWLAIADGAGGCISIWLSGLTIARFAANGVHAKTRLMALSAILVVPLALIVLWAPSKDAALLAYLLLSLPLLFYVAPTAILVQELVGSHQRATMAALFFLIQMLLGAVIANQLIGAASDALVSASGDSALGLRLSMTFGVMTSFWAAFHYWRAGRDERAA